MSSTITPPASCITAIPDKNGWVPSNDCNANFNYHPSLPAAAIFATLFGLSFLLHIYQSLDHHKLKLCWPLELVSFALRCYAVSLQQSTAIAFVSQILLLLAPMWVNAFVYMVLGRLIYFLVPEKKVLGVPGIKIAKVFVWLDVASFLTQVGGGQRAQDDHARSAYLHRWHRIPGSVYCPLHHHRHLLPPIPACPPSIQPHLACQTWQLAQIDIYVLYLVLALITVRIVFRMAEFASGLDPDKTPIPYHEAHFMALNALPMAIAVLVLNVVHPGAVLQGEGSEFPKGKSRKEKRAEKKARKEEKWARRAGVVLRDGDQVELLNV